MQEQVVIRGLDFLGLGADDYLGRPFSFPELVARVRARLRRAAIQASTPPSSSPRSLEAGDLTLDPAQGSVAYAGRPLRLTRTEFRVLEYLLRHDLAGLAHAEVVVPTRTLLEAVWGGEHTVGPEAVRVTMFRLQHKLTNAGARNLRIVHSVGFVVQAERS